MTTVVPTITAGSKGEFQQQFAAVKPFAKRIHLDLMDGVFAPSTSLPVREISFPSGLTVDVHVMFAEPGKQLDALLALKPSLLIVHAEAKGDFAALAKSLQLLGVKAGVALLPETPVSAIAEAMALLDHVLIFSGNLGYQGGSRADPNLLYKVDEIRRLKPTIEIGWDGGINDENAKALSQAGINVLNVGGYIQRSTDPEHMYKKLVKACA